MEEKVISKKIWRCLVVDLLMQHEFCYVNLIGRKLENVTNKPNKTRIPCIFSHDIIRHIAMVDVMLFFDFSTNVEYSNL